MFVCLLGHRYGYIPQVEASKAEPRSFVELEYERARERGKPIVAFRIQEERFAAAILDDTGGLGQFHSRLE